MYFTAAAVVLLSSAAFQANAATIAEANFPGADGSALAGSSAGTGLSGTWTVTGQSLTVNNGSGGGWAGASGFAGANGGASVHSAWWTSRATIGLSATVDLTTDTTFILSYKMMSDSNDTGVQVGLSDGTNDLLAGKVYSWGGVGAGIEAINAGGMSPPAGSDNSANLALTYGGTDYYQVIATLTRAGGNLTVNTSYYLNGGGSAVVSNTANLGAVSATYNALVLKQDGWNGVSDITLASVPEPSAALLGGLGMLGLLRRRRNA